MVSKSVSDKKKAKKRRARKKRMIEKKKKTKRKKFRRLQKIQKTKQKISQEKVSKKQDKLVNDHEMIKNWLEQHNKRRAKFSTASGRKIPPLVWDEQLAIQAKEWAQKLVDEGKWRHPESTKELAKYLELKDICTMGENGSACGQNLATAMGSANSREASDPSPEKSLIGWVDKECPLYNGKLSSESGHYSQAMWAGAKKVGCAIVQSQPFESNGRHFDKGGVAACNYDTGNIVDGESFKDNVPSPGVC